LTSYWIFERVRGIKNNSHFLFTTIAKIAHAEVKSKGCTSGARVVRFQRMRPGLDILPGSRWWLLKW
ncbi:hypothetical protein, partial [Mucilaginibacter boryungensis]|uniref:hypothetical protein n=1 Tax=Mucilaginibacter boryungensis TaxID=768480 RepID=UPI0036439C7D